LAVVKEERHSHSPASESVSLIIHISPDRPPLVFTDHKPLWQEDDSDDVQTELSMELRQKFADLKNGSFAKTADNL
jgi:hypothetical protein